MPKHTISNNAKCPYYRCEDRHEIFCDGLSAGMGTHVAFSSPAERKQWTNDRCKSMQGYHSCPVKQMLEKNEKK